MAGKPHRIDAISFLKRTNTHDYDADMCWEWLGSGKGNGYGHTSRGPAHRVSYELFVGDIPPSMDVCHRCDNRWCVNPYHLFVGTRRDNMADMKMKGRGAGGCRKHLSESQVQEIMRRINAGVPLKIIAETMGVNYGTVTSIKRGKSYVKVA